ncbi:hypothetical protein LY76DRAFT_598888, partial [Colletotrichum caudatum]
MGGPGGSDFPEEEREAIVGLMNPGPVDPPTLLIRYITHALPRARGGRFDALESSRL